MAYESARPPETSPADHEAMWRHNQELRDILSELQKTIQQYSLLLAKVAGIPSLVT